jgi:hypothetical protein
MVLGVEKEEGGVRKVVNSGQEFILTQNETQENHEECLPFQ